MGYLIPAKHPSLVEVAAAAAPYGAPFTAGPDMYKTFAPYSEDRLRAIGGGRLPSDPVPAATPAKAAAPVPTPVPAK